MTTAAEGHQQSLEEQEQLESLHPNTQVHIGDLFMSVDIGKLATALAKAQGKMGSASKDSRNDHFKSSYADLSSCIDAWREPLSAAGIAMVQLPFDDAGKVGLRTMLLHSSGEYIGTAATITPQKSGPHPFGSCLTYLRRYMGSAIAGISQADDDANAGQAETKGKPVGPATDVVNAEKTLTDAAKMGTSSLKATWEGLSNEERNVIGNTRAEFWQKLKNQAADVDAAAQE